MTQGTFFEVGEIDDAAAAQAAANQVMAGKQAEAVFERASTEARVYLVVPPL